MTMVGLMSAQFSKPLVVSKATHLVCHKFKRYLYARSLPNTLLAVRGTWSNFSRPNFLKQLEGWKNLFPMIYESMETRNH